jgi:hypothetical protein
MPSLLSGYEPFRQVNDLKGEDHHARETGDNHDGKV